MFIWLQNQLRTRSIIFIPILLNQNIFHFELFRKFDSARRIIDRNRIKSKTSKNFDNIKIRRLFVFFVQKRDKIFRQKTFIAPIFVVFFEKFRNQV